VKFQQLAQDWIMRATGDLACRPLVVWRSGLLAELPDCIDHAMVGVAATDGGAAILMRDVGPWLVPEGDEPIPLPAHLRFLDHMAALHARFWGWQDDIGLMPLSTRYLEFAPSVADCERARGFPDAVTRVIDEGWRRLPTVAPRAADIVLPLTSDPDPLVRALEATPTTFVHGDWKLGNLGSHPDGRTILLDWAVPGTAPACADLAWYLALNRARLPIGHTKDDAIASYREALERHGVETEPWWDRQLTLCLLGAMVQFGWEKAFDETKERAWWEEHVVAGSRWLS